MGRAGGMTYSYPCCPKGSELTQMVILVLVWNFEGGVGNQKVNVYPYGEPLTSWNVCHSVVIKAVSFLRSIAKLLYLESYGR